MITKKSSTTSFIAAILLLTTLLGFTGCIDEIPFVKEKMRENNNKEVERVIKENPEFQEVDNICKQIPLPQEFKLISRLRLFNSVGISNFYYSQIDYDSSDNSFREYFTKNGWQIIETNSLNRISTFRKDKYEVAIQYGGIGGADANYSIHCGKLTSK